MGLASSAQIGQEPIPLNFPLRPWNAEISCCVESVRSVSPEGLDIQTKLDVVRFNTTLLFGVLFLRKTIEGVLV